LPRAIPVTFLKIGTMALLASASSLSARLKMLGHPCIDGTGRFGRAAFPVLCINDRVGAVSGSIADRVRHPPKRLENESKCE